MDELLRVTLRLIISLLLLLWVIGIFNAETAINLIMFVWTLKYGIELIDNLTTKKPNKKEK